MLSKLSFMNDSKTKISIIFPSYNGEKFLCKNLKSIQQLSNLNEIELVIVDNNSNDSTKEIIKSFNHKINITLIEQESNLGFAKACNIGVFNAKGKYIFITNQDVIFPEDFFKIILFVYHHYKKDQNIIVCPAIVFPDNTINYFGAKIHFLGFSYTTQMYQKIKATTTTFKTQKISGCSMLIKKKKFLELNGFDPYFFMYQEDTDFSLRANRHHMSIYTTNETILIHQKDHFILNAFTYYYIERNRYLCLFKNIDNLKDLIPYLIISELMLLVQAILTKQLKIRFKIYKFLIQNYQNIKYLRINKSNSKTKKIRKYQLSSKLDSIVLGKSLFNNKLLKKILKIVNFIF